MAQQDWHKAAEELDHSPGAVDLQGVAYLVPLVVEHLVFFASHAFVFSHFELDFFLTILVLNVLFQNRVYFFLFSYYFKIQGLEL